MKITKSGKVKLEKNDYRLGNYVFHIEDSHIKVSDINMMVSWRLNNLLLGSGLLLNEALKMAKNDVPGGKAFLERYVTAIHLVLSTVPDVKAGNDYLGDLIELSTKCIKRHPEVYGLESEPSEEKNEKDLNAVKELEKIKEELEKQE